MTDAEYLRGLELVKDGMNWRDASFAVGFSKDHLRREHRLRTEAGYIENLRAMNYGNNSTRMTKLRAIIAAEKSQPCVDCGKQYPWQVMDLDHVRGKKTRNVGNGSGFNEETLREEIGKCEVRCPTCHRLRHFFEKNPAAQLRLVA